MKQLQTAREEADEEQRGKDPYQPRGRLPVPSGFEETALRLPRGEVGGEEVVAQVVPVVADVVKRQVEIGLDCVGDGEYWSALDIKWFDQQMTGLSTRLLKPGEVGSMRESTRERDVFRTLYVDMNRVGTIACIPGERPRPPTRERIIVNRPIKSRGTAATCGIDGQPFCKRHGFPPWQPSARQQGRTLRENLAG